jgi:hypothetical protein
MVKENQKKSIITIQLQDRDTLMLHYDNSHIYISYRHYELNKPIMDYDI